MEHDLDNRKQVITLSNNGSAAVSKARVLLRIDSTKPRPVADFWFGREDGTPRVSLFNNLIALDSIGPGSNSDVEQLMAVFDRHSTSRTLFGLEETFDQILSTKLKTKKPLLELVTALEGTNSNYDDWHRGWFQHCYAHKISTQSCTEGYNLLAAWENSKRDLLVKGQRRWYEATGAALLHKSNHLSPDNEVDLTFDLGGNESAVLEIEYNTDPSMIIDPKAWFSSSSIGPTTQVTDKAYLKAPLPLFIFKYYSKTFAFVVVLAVFLLWFSWPVLIPKPLLSISRVFRVALKEKDDEFWDYALQRHRFHIIQQLQELKQHFNKTHIVHESEQILDWVRNCLVTAYDKEPGKFATDKKLNRMIRSGLRIYVLSSP